MFSLKQNFKDQLPYIPKEQRKTILLLSDDCRLHSGIATMSREIIQKTAHHFNWVQLGAALTHPDIGKIFDLSQETNKLSGITDSSVKIYPNNGYGDANLLRQLIDIEKPDAIMHFTDPRYWIWLYQMAYEIRSKIPIVYYTIWDDLPYPFYNKSFYESCDALYCISKQTYNIVKNVLSPESAEKKQIKYIPHGVDSTIFFPIDKDDETLKQFKSKLYGNKDYNFAILYNNRNIRRKNPADLLMAFKEFLSRCRKDLNPVLLMKTHPVDENGTNLYEVAKMIDPTMPIIWIEQPLSSQDMNLLYNVADVTVNVASNEGWGLSSTESLMSGTCIINNVTGGLQDQCRFTYDDTDTWIDFGKDFPSNHTGMFKERGKWAFPIFPSNRSIQGSPLTPYIFDDRVNATQICKALLTVSTPGREELDKRGMEGREWVMSEEAKMEATLMAHSIGSSINQLLETWTPVTRIQCIKVEEELTPSHNGILY